LNKWRAAAALWGGATILLAAALGLQLKRGMRFETDMLALLPVDAARPLVGETVSRMAEAGSRRIVLLVGGSDLAQAARAADACASRLNGQKGIASATALIEGDMAGLARDFYFPWRYRMLNGAQRTRLTQEKDGPILADAVKNLYSPVGPPRLAPLESDPFGLFSEGLLDAASRSSLRFQENRLTVSEGGMIWVVVPVELAEAGMAIAEQRSLLKIFDDAVQAARDAGASDVLRAGFLFHSAQASKQALREISTIGAGSMIGIVLLMLLAFGSLKPLALTLLPIGVGFVTALSLSQLIFSRLHLMTLVFGSSIIGVAVDYGVLFVSGCTAGGPWDAGKRRRDILPAVALAVATSLLAYAALAAMPFPILRQMGVFAMLGLAGAWLTAVLWVPLLAKSLPRPSNRALSSALLWCRRVWPRVGESRPLVAALSIAAVLSLVGIGRLRADDDVRQLYQSAPETVRQQEKIERLMRLPAAGQFFLVSAPDEQTLLEREEGLSDELRALTDNKSIGGYQAVSQYVPSLKRQEADAALQWKRIYRPGALASQLFARLESPEVAATARAQAAAKIKPLTPETWLASPLSTPFRPLWLHRDGSEWASVVTLTGVDNAAALELLSGLAKRREGVEFVDHLASVAGLLKRFRAVITKLMVGGYAAVSALLLLRYRGEAWRVLLPTVLACLGTAGLFGALGLNCNLFCVFGLLLSADMGVDYGIYMQDKGSGDFRVSLLSTSLAAMTALLSFGLLALSRTPALRVFGLTVLLAISGSWLLAPCFFKGEI
jgi:predicted exporter